LLFLFFTQDIAHKDGRYPPVRVTVLDAGLQLAGLPNRIELSERFWEEIRAHPIDARLAHVLKYGGASREAMQRWIKDYYQWIRMDAQGTAAMIARCQRRGLFLALSPLVSRKTGFYQVTTPALERVIRPPVKVNVPWRPSIPRT